MVSVDREGSGSDPDTDALLAGASRGDPVATAQLFERHRGRLKRMVAIRMHPLLSARVDPSDVVQEGLLVAAKRLPDYLAKQPVAFYPWLRQMTFERLVELHRTHIEREKRDARREVPISIALPDKSAALLVNRLVDARSSDEQRLIRKELHLRVRTTLDQLPDIYREVLVLRHLEQLSNEETASVLGVSEATVKTRYYRAIARMQQALSSLQDDS